MLDQFLQVRAPFKFVTLIYLSPPNNVLLFNYLMERTPCSGAGLNEFSCCQPRVRYESRLVATHRHWDLNLRLEEMKLFGFLCIVGVAWAVPMPATVQVSQRDQKEIDEFGS